jgi:hypothetical protein
MNLPYTTIGGDFDGTRALLVPDIEKFVLPDLDANIGFGFTLGYARVSPEKLGYAGEFSYQRTSHDDSKPIPGYVSYDAVQNVFNFDFKGLYSLNEVEPYLLIGVVIPWLKVKNAALDVASSPLQITDATFRGIGFNIGGGTDFFMHPRISFGARLVYRFIHYNTAEGYERYTIDGGMSGSGLNISGIITYNILLK